MPSVFTCTLNVDLDASSETVRRKRHRAAYHAYTVHWSVAEKGSSGSIFLVGWTEEPNGRQQLHQQVCHWYTGAHHRPLGKSLCFPRMLPASSEPVIAFDSDQNNRPHRIIWVDHGVKKAHGLANCEILGSYFLDRIEFDQSLVSKSSSYMINDQVLTLT